MKQNLNHSYRLACLLVLGCLLGSLAACGGNPPVTETGTPAANPSPGESTPTGNAAPVQSPGPDQEGESSVPADPGEETGAEAGEGVVITFAGSEYDSTLYEPIIEDFNRQNPGITVQFSVIPEPQPNEQGEIVDYYRILATSGDTTLLWNVAYMPTGQRAYFRDITPLMESDPTFDANDFWEGIEVACMDPDGRTLGVPLTVNFNGVYFNEEAFDAAGLPRPKPGWTLEDFRKAVLALSKNSGETLQYGHAEQYNSLINPYLEIAIEGSAGEVDLDLLEPIAQWYLSMVEAKALRPVPYYEENSDTDWQKVWEEWQAMFQSEARPAMWMGSLSEMMPGSEGNFSPDDPFANAAFKLDGFLPYPVDGSGLTGEATENTTPAWVMCAAISDGTSHPREAWTWLNFLSQRWLVRDKTNLWEVVSAPARISAAERDGYWQSLPDEVEPAVRYILEHAWFGSSYPEVSAAVSQAISKAAAGKADFAAELQNYEERASAAPTPTPDTTPIVIATPRPTLAAGIDVVEYYMSAWGEEKQAVQAAVEAYNKSHPEVAVKLSTEFSTSAGEDYFAAMGEKFDCFTFYTPYFPSQSPDGLLSLNSLVESEGEAFLQDFEANLLDLFRHEGQLYALPAVGQPQMISYNADLLAKRGLQPPSNDWTFDDFISLVTQAASPSATDLSYGMISGEWDDFLFTNRDIPWADVRSDPPVPKFDDPQFAAGLAWLKDLIDSGVIFIQTDQNWEEQQKVMEKGQIAFWLSQAGMPQGWNLPEGQKLDYQIGVAVMPSATDPDAVVYGSSALGHFITRRAQDPQLCWDWIKYLSEQPTAFRGVPARKSVAASPQWETLVGKQNAETYRLALKRIPRLEEDQITTSPIAWPFYNWRREVVAALMKGEDYLALLPEVQKKAEEYLACMKLVDRAQVKDQELNEKINACAKQADPQGNWGP